MIYYVLMKREIIEQIYDQGKEVMVNFVENLLTEFKHQTKDQMNKIKNLEVNI